MFTTLFSGLLLGLAIIMPLGTQNMCVIYNGLTKNRINLVILLTIACDLLLIVTGVVLYSTFINTFKDFKLPLFILSELYILYIAATYLTKFSKGTANVGSGFAETVGSTVSGTISANLLNPYALLETFIILGGIINQQDNKIDFLYGLMLASIIWFPTIGYGAYLISNTLLSTKPSKYIDLVGGISMLLVAIALLLSYQ